MYLSMMGNELYKRVINGILNLKNRFHSHKSHFKYSHSKKYNVYSRAIGTCNEQ